MTATQTLLRRSCALAEDYLGSLPGRQVMPTAAALAGLAGLHGPLPEDPTDPLEVLTELDRLGSPATVGSAGGRFFGFVVGGTLPVTIAASWLATA